MLGFAIASLTASASSAQRLRRGELAGENVDARSQVERQRQDGQRAGVAGELDLSGGEHEPAFVVPQIHGGAAREPQPADPVLAGELVGAERPQCPLQHRRSGGIPLRVQHRKPVEEKIWRSRWFRRRGCPACRIRRLAHAVAGAQATGGDRRGQRLQIGHARNAGIERLEPFGRLEQQGWGVSATVDGELDLTAQQLHLRALELVQRSGLCDGNQS